MPAWAFVEPGSVSAGRGRAEMLVPRPCRCRRAVDGRAVAAAAHRGRAAGRGPPPGAAHPGGHAPACGPDGHPWWELTVAPERAGRRPVSAVVEACPGRAPEDDGRGAGLLARLLRAALTGGPVAGGPVAD